MMVKIKRVWWLSLLALILTMLFMIQQWYNSQLIQRENLMIHCHEMNCRYEVTLKNPGKLQGTQLIWVAHKVTQQKGNIISWIVKDTEEVAGEKIYMMAGSQRRVTGVFRKPRHTSYMVLKLRPVE